MKLFNKRAFRRGFSLFEIIVAMFVMLVGLLGIFAVFGSGLNSRLLAQEITVSQDLANMWADLVRFNNFDPNNVATGDFYTDTRLLTNGCNVYRGYTWLVTSNNASYQPQWVTNDNNTNVLHNFGEGALDAAPSALKEVELTVYRGSRSYKFHYVFSGVGLKYN
ncbi:MAG: prepilin-type N-terminal cleavage/methylation domain-containing protein [Planctomycetota bacterium]